MTIEFQCPNCSRTLKTKDEKAGATAKCPNCSTFITVPNPVATRQELEDPCGSIQSDEFTDESSSAQPASSAIDDSVTCTICGEQNPGHSTICRACGENLKVRVYDRPLRQKEVDIGIIFSEAWEAYKENIGMSIAAVFVPAIIVGVSALVLLLFPIMMLAADEKVGLALLLIGIFVLILLVIYLGLGSTNMLLKIARRLPVEIGDLFTIGRFYMRAVLITLVLGLVFSLFICICSVAIGALMAAAGAAREEAAIIAIIAAYGLMTVAGILVSMVTWPCMYLLIDRDEPGLGALTTSFKLFKYHWIASLVFIIVGVVINQLGAMACYVGIIFTIPYVELLFTVTYCQLAGYKTAAR